jgi:hypothetical protein
MFVGQSFRANTNLLPPPFSGVQPRTKVNDQVGIQETVMWTSEHSVETSAAREDIWRLWADVAGWPEWNGDIERIELRGTFAAGSTILMTQARAETIELLIADAVEPWFFVDEAVMGDIVVRTIHRVERIAGERSRVTYRMEISAGAAGTPAPEIGPEISVDLPQTLVALVAHAENRLSVGRTTS